MKLQLIDQFLNRIPHTKFHSILWAVHKTLFPFPKEWFDANEQAANDRIRELLEADAPCLVSRLGKTETETVMAYLYKDQFMWPWERAYRFLSMDLRYKGWKKIAPKVCTLSGVFPPTPDLLESFCKIYLSSMSQIDLVGSWLHMEILLKDRMEPLQRIPFPDLEPYRHESPWSQALKGKKVLVIHPFEASISQQYAKRELLFENLHTLPEFQLTILKAVQSLGGKSEFPTWLEALESMKQKIATTDFDVALIGAGAYGLPLGAYVKSIGKKAVHLGGALQTLFGIYGKRHLTKGDTSLINEHWIRPLGCDRIENYKSVEDGCYW